MHRSTRFPDDQKLCLREDTCEAKRKKTTIFASDCIFTFAVQSMVQGFNQYERLNLTLRNIVQHRDMSGKTLFLLTNGLFNLTSSITSHARNSIFAYKSHGFGSNKDLELK